MNKIILISLLILIGFLFSGCISTRQPVVNNNKSDKYVYARYNNRYIIDVLKNTPKAKKVLVQKLRKAVRDVFKDLPSNLKYKETMVDVDRCYYPRGRNVSSVQAYNRMRENCRKIYNYNYIVSEKKKVYVSGAKIDYSETTYLEYKNNSDIIFSFRIKIRNKGYEKYTYYIEENGEDLIIYRTSNVLYPYTYVTNLINKIIDGNKELVSRKLKYYKF